MRDTRGYQLVQSSYEPLLQCECEGSENANGEVAMKEEDVKMQVVNNFPFNISKFVELASELIHIHCLGRRMKL